MFDKKKESIMNTTVDRKRIFIFVAIAYGISIALAVVVYLNGGLGLSGDNPFAVAPQAVILLQALMFAPLVANIVTRLVTREGWSNTLLRPNLRRGWRFYLAAWLLPIVATIVGGAIYYLLFPSRFDPSMTWAREIGLVAIGKDLDPGTFLLVQVAMALAMSVTMGLLLGLGEEFGWRAYLLPKLMPLGGRKAVLLVGVIHGIWHWPFIFMGYEYGFGYPGAPVVGPLLFVVFVVFLSAFLAWVTVRTGSVWPAALGHAAVNASVLLMVFFVRGDLDRLIGPLPVGIVGALGYALLAVLILFNARALAQSAPATVAMAMSENAGVVGQAADQAKLGAA
jgi:membrane protease YdiL (CAAX protease family)